MNIDHLNLLTPENQLKLSDYKQILPTYLKPSDHFRYTCNIYKEKGRKLNYGVVQDVLEDGKLLVNGYKSDHKDWVIDPLNKPKHFCFYVRTKDERKEVMNVRRLRTTG